MHAPNSSPQLDLPVFNTPVRWTLRVLAWIAFCVSAYLAWHAVTHSHVAGCGVGGDSGCDRVLSSGWSKWLGVPVAVPGLACYASLAALSVLLGWRNSPLTRWITTAFVMLATVAALASIWFLALQVFAIGHFCMFCIVTDLCGIALGAIAIGSLARWLRDTRYLRKARTAASGLAALRTAMPAGARPVTAVPNAGVPLVSATRAVPTAATRLQPAPSLTLILGGAAAIMLLLIGGQLLFPTKGYELQQVALTESIDMNGGSTNEPAEPRLLEGDERVALRVPTETDEPEQDTAKDNDVDTSVVPAGFEETVAQANTDTSSTVGEQPEAQTAPDRKPVAEPAPAKKRVVKLLNGKLELDLSKHPLIGSPDAPHVIVEMVSYNCHHCRATHKTIKQALARYGNQVAIVLMVIPMERECNHLITSSAGSTPGACATARMALGVAHIKPAAFAKFHDWLMADKDKPPALPTVIARAYKVVDRDRLRELTGGDQLKKQIESYVNLFATLQRQHTGSKTFGLPVQILGDHVMTGSVDKPADLYKAWEENLGVKPR